MKWPGLFIAAGLLAACGGEPLEEPAPNPGAAKILPGQALASACSGCHATGGSAISDLSAWAAADIAASLQAYKSDTGGMTVMHRLARGYSEGEIDLIADYLAAGSEAVQ